MVSQYCFVGTLTTHRGEVASRARGGYAREACDLVVVYWFFRCSIATTSSRGDAFETFGERKDGIARPLLTSIVNNSVNSRQQ